MLTLTDDYRFIATVQWRIKARAATFDVECRLLEPDRVSELQGQLSEGKMTLEQFIGEWLCGWPEGQVRDKAGAPLPFSAENLAWLLRQPQMPVAVLNAFYEGYEVATEGNSAPLSAG